jgi:Transmembrane domain of unknown function (DUF3566)
MAVRGGVGVDHHVEPQPSLPEGATAAVTEEATVASGQADADAASEQVSLNGTHNNDEQQLSHPPAPLPAEVGALNGSQEAAAADPDPDAGPAAEAGAEAEAGPEAGADPISYSQEGAFSYEHAGLDADRQDPSYTTDYPAAQSGYNDGMSQSRHNDGMSPPVGGESPVPVPPYPAELRHGEPATVTTQPEPIVAAAPVPKARTKVGKASPAPRRANLVVARLEPWSVMKFSFLMSLVAWVVLFVAVTLLYYALSGLGVFATIQRTLSSVTSSQDSAGVNLAAWTSASRVLGYTMLAGAVDIVLITVLATIGAMIYNLVTHLGGGIEVTLKETD